MKGEAMGLLGAKDAGELRRVVERGLPGDSVEALIARVPKAQRRDWREILPRPENGARLSPEASDRAARLAYILDLAKEVWGGVAPAHVFLTKPHPLLDGQAPLQAAKTEWGGRAVEELLRKIQFGLPA